MSVASETASTVVVETAADDGPMAPDAADVGDEDDPEVAAMTSAAMTAAPTSAMIAITIGLLRTRSITLA